MADERKLVARRRALFAAGFAGLLIALLSVVDMFLPKPYDGVVPDPYATGGILVRDLVPGGAAEKAGIRAGDVILGIGHKMLNKPIEAPPELRRHGIGEKVSYLVRRAGQTRELNVVLSHVRLGSASYFYYALLGGLFFGLGMFVLSQRQDDPAAQIFFVLCTLFMLFFVCRLRPSSYYWIDYFVQVAGTLALFLLPAVFLHFFLYFPQRKVFRFGESLPGEPPAARPLRILQRFLNGSPLFFALLYTLPPVLYVLQMAVIRASGKPERLIYGAPIGSWVLLADYLILGLLALAHSWWTNQDPATRRPILVLLVGTVAGIVPFVLFAVYFPSLFRNERYLAWGVVPMAIIPITFAYAIVKFRLFDVRVIVRKSIVYATLTAVVTSAYALAIVAANAIASAYASSSALFQSPYFGLAFGIVVVLFVDPLRRRMQNVVDRLFFRDRADFQQALLEMSRTVMGQLEKDKLHELLTVRAEELMRLDKLLLLTPRPEDGQLSSGSRSGEALVLPGGLLARMLLERDAPIRLAEIDPWSLDEGSRRFREAAQRRGVKALVPLATRGRLFGVLAATRKKSEEELDREDLDHLMTLANQGALGLEAASLHEELKRRAEMERDLEIARDIQMSLFPRELPVVAGFSFFGSSRPARVVGGDFYDFLEIEPSPASGTGPRLGIVLGDVSGKSVAASLLMVAAKEIVHALAMADPDPAVIFRDANKRIYDIKRRMFVSLAYFLLDPVEMSLRYSIGGQPTPLLVRKGAREAVEIPTPVTRLPLGAFREVVYESSTLYLSEGDTLLFYTDGLNEAMSLDQTPYGDERLKASLVRHASRPLDELSEEISEDIRQFTYGAEQYDDMTFVLLRVSRNLGPRSLVS